ncbi:MAG: ImmA/IrrE family metallo-endopeptidase [Deltaproteobacteria bacterium]|nr:ImmA/IrrE family metallo-endopeptidase [Deltaproteobacteria bacterium]MBW2072895.1 ImmA/IrrE family metallo-endopeptidase [Deltaproteobacteria bacterium]
MDQSQRLYYPPGKARTWHHPSVRGLQETHGVLLPPEEIIRRRAAELVAYGRQFSWGGPPYDPRVLASILGIRVRKQNLAAGTDGVLRVDHRGQLEILINRRLWKTRENFTICHEIAHTLFPDCFEIVRLRQRQDRVEPYHWELESLCNLAAAELLMPMDCFARDVVYYGYSLETAAALQRQYGASFEAVVRRLIATELEICCAVFLRYMAKPSEEKPGPGRSNNHSQKKLRVAYAVPSMDFHYFMPRFKSAPSHSCVNRCVRRKEVFCATEDWKLRAAPPFRIEARACEASNGAGHNHHKVAALFFPQTSSLQKTPGK